MRKPEGQIRRTGKHEFTFTLRKEGVERSWSYPTFDLARMAARRRKGQGWAE